MYLLARSLEANSSFYKNNSLEEIVETDKRKEVPKHIIEYRIERIKSLIQSHEVDEQ